MTTATAEKPKEKELPGMPEKGVLTDLCEDFSDIKEKIHGLTDKKRIVTERIIGEMERIKKSQIRFLGYIFTVDTGKKKLRVTEAKE